MNSEKVKEILRGMDASDKIELIRATTEKGIDIEDDLMPVFKFIFDLTGENSLLGKNMRFMNGGIDNE